MMNRYSIWILLLLVAAGPVGAAVAPTVGARVSTSLLGSASVSLTFGDNHRFCCTGCDCSGAAQVKGLSLLGEAGLGGGQVGLGAALVIYDRWWLPAVAVGARAVVVRTWGSQWLTEPSQTYVGIQGDAAFNGVGVRLGVLKRAGGDTAARDWLFAAGLGYGF